MFGMNSEQIIGQARIFLTFFAGIAAALGLTWYGAVSEAFIAALGPALAAVGPVIGFATAIWSAINKKQANILATAKALTDVNGAPVVEHILLAPTVAGHQLEAATPSGVSTKPPPMMGVTR